MSFSQIPTSVSIISSGLKSYQAISLTNFVASAESLIASGSAVEVVNAFFLADSNITPNASSWTAVGTGNTAYIVVTPSGSAGVQILSAAYTDVDPTWILSKAGWYASAASLTRYVGGVFKDATASYANAFVMPTQQADQIMITKSVEIGVWDMQGTPNLTVDLAITKNKIVEIGVMIFGDTTTSNVPLDYTGTGSAAAGYFSITNNRELIMARVSGRLFDSASFNGAANRGWITYTFIP